MKNKAFIILLGLIIGFSLNSFSNPVVKKTTKGKQLLMDIVLEGSIDLFSIESEVLKSTIPEDPMEDYFETKITLYVCNINGDEVTKLTSSNYKKVLSAYCDGKTELLEKIGKKGYRFNDIQKIIQEYNAC
jgi:hypothetical protein